MTPPLAILPALRFPRSISEAQLRRYATDAAFRSRALLLLSAKARRLHVILGPDLYSRVVWEHESPELERYYPFRPLPPIDHEHVAKMLTLHNPPVLLTFTNAMALASLVGWCGSLLRVPPELLTDRASPRAQLAFANELENLLAAHEVQKKLADKKIMLYKKRRARNLEPITTNA